MSTCVEATGTARQALVDVTRERTSRMNCESKPSADTKVVIRTNNPYAYDVIGDPDSIPLPQSPLSYWSHSARSSAQPSPVTTPIHRSTEEFPAAYNISSPVCVQPPAGRLKRVYHNGRPMPVVVPTEEVTVAGNWGAHVACETRQSMPSLMDEALVQSSFVCLVQFRLTTTVYGDTEVSASSTPYRSDVPHPPGTWVIVEGDRGVHIGTVYATYGEDEYQPPAGTHRRVVRNLSVRRAATTQEIERYSQNPAAEAQALDFAMRTAEALDLPMCVRACELQLDGGKLTLHYVPLTQKTNEVVFVPFHSLLKALHAKFKCRIWLNDQSPARHGCR